MAIKTVAELKTKFETGDKPTGQDFIDLIDSFLHAGFSNWPATLPASNGAALTGITVPNPLPAVDGGALYNINPQEYNAPGAMPAPSYATATTFVVAGDWTAASAVVAQRVFLIGRRLRLTVNDVYFYTEVTNATVVATATEVTIANPMGSNQLTAAFVSIITPNNAGGSVGPNTVFNATGNSTLQGSVNYVVAAGTNTYTGTLGLGVLVTGTRYRVKFTNAATLVNPTINFDSLGARTIVRPQGGQLLAGDIPAGYIGELMYDGTNMVLLNPRWQGWEVADIRASHRVGEDPGWIKATDGTIGNASSGGTQRANADTEALFTHYWNNFANTECPVSTGRGASAAADFAADKNLAIPKSMGRALAVAGAGAGLTARVLGHTIGAETHTLSTAEMPTHKHTLSGNINAQAVGALASLEVASNDVTTISKSIVNDVSAAMANTGSGAAHNNMQPSTFINIFVKL